MKRAISGHWGEGFQQIATLELVQYASLLKPQITHPAIQRSEPREPPFPLCLPLTLGNWLSPAHASPSVRPTEQLAVLGMQSVHTFKKPKAIGMGL